MILLGTLSIEKTYKIAALYQKIAAEEKCDFLDAALIVKSSELDGVHLGEQENKLLGLAVAEKAK